MFSNDLEEKKLEYEILEKEVALENIKLIEKKGDGIKIIMNRPSRPMDLYGAI